MYFCIPWEPLKQAALTLLNSQVNVTSLMESAWTRGAGGAVPVPAAPAAVGAARQGPRSPQRPCPGQDGCLPHAGCCGHGRAAAAAWESAWGRRRPQSCPYVCLSTSFLPSVSSSLCTVKHIGFEILLQKMADWARLNLVGWLSKYLWKNSLCSAPESGKKCCFGISVRLGFGLY